MFLNSKTGFLSPPSTILSVQHLSLTLGTPCEDLLSWRELWHVSEACVLDCLNNLPLGKTTHGWKRVPILKTLYKMLHATSWVSWACLKTRSVSGSYWSKERQLMPDEGRVVLLKLGGIYFGSIVQRIHHGCSEVVSVTNKWQLNWEEEKWEKKG